MAASVIILLSSILLMISFVLSSPLDYNLEPSRVLEPMSSIDSGSKIAALLEASQVFLRTHMYTKWENKGAPKALPCPKPTRFYQPLDACEQKSSVNRTGRRVIQSLSRPQP
ncbi:hypothetical protein H072_6893 [Dactylellina haptotyla CBS 200.50]|uniref:Uncharacterized protein n=1 Tax=Dactylellina haptotyla (strain CBS 200.50) TaxID=1284197 RepID=S8BVC6_DACHA|nr:hypothetical protein H072_6893 [Dactylellina haptotyla CBS 200.50]